MMAGVVPLNMAAVTAAINANFTHSIAPTGPRLGCFAAAPSGAAGRKSCVASLLDIFWPPCPNWFKATRQAAFYICKMTSCIAMSVYFIQYTYVK